ALAASS
nr:Chain PA, ALAASS Peptide [synthetic construct]